MYGAQVTRGLAFLLRPSRQPRVVAEILMDSDAVPYVAKRFIKFADLAVLARILTELKLLTTDIGRMAMSAAAVNDVAAWILLVLAIALSGSYLSLLVPLWVFLSGCAFVFCLILVIPPIFKWMGQRCHGGEAVDEIYICATLASVLATGFVTDAIGIHAMFGAFVVGVLVPKGLTICTCFGKIFGTALVSRICKLPLREALALGFLMNSKGLVELIVLNIGRDRKSWLKRDNRVDDGDYKHKTIERENPDTELRILACFLPTKPGFSTANDINLFTDMHEDICTTAKNKRAAIIILPFHKHQRLDGSLETTGTDFRLVNRKVLKHAPCSVGIFIDRGLGGNTHVSASNVSYFITVLFFGGRDDREALAYGVRMAEHPGIRLTIICFSVEPGTIGEIVRVDTDESSFAKLVSADEEFLSLVKQKVSKDSSVKYEEKFVRSAAETIAVVRDLSRCNLFLVGRTPESEVALALKGKSKCPELGPIGDLLTSPVLSTTASVLLVQQYFKMVPADSTSKMVEELPDGDSVSS
ncbi:hypothetical protein RJ639_047400 [Escallonia herrerae]|uniref:Cation/H+ exchanger domain-containing protein n=1 Tax=Escallonia herrerae TaxID=1293975 RepID=A0AA88W691_9ASTE|nr:hypothetical protein RJ639_047400 [Escallonia herrerae]